MYEFHGWITVRETYENRDTEDEVLYNLSCDPKKPLY